MTNDPEHLEHLIGDHLDGVLDQRGQQELAEILAASADARTLLASHMRIHGAVCQLGRAGVIKDSEEEKGERENKPTAAPRIRVVATLAGIAACLAVAVVAGYWLMPETTAPEHPVIAAVVEARGAIRRSGDQATDLRDGASIYSGDTICTTADTVISFPDGTIAALDERSDATFNLDDGAKHIDLHGGLLRLDVAGQPAGKPLVVQTPKAKVIVLGTSFSIEASKDHTEVAVTEGTVRLKAGDGEQASVEVGAGEVARVNKRGLTTKKTQIVYWDGQAKRVHARGCRRLTTDPEELAKMTKMTLAEARKKGLPLCSRCPGSTTPGKGNPAGGKKSKKRGNYRKYGRKGAKARKARLQIPEKHYDPNTKVYCDALWMRVHEENCPMLVLKDMKKTMTLEQADKEGWRIGESGQSGRDHCCFHGYRRKYPEKEITDDSIGIVQKMKSGKWKFHMAGCHRFKVSRDNKVMTLKEAKKLPGFYMCSHCTERGPSVTYVDAEKLAKMPANGPADPPYVNPLAAMEEFMGRRFFFSYSGAYKRYRSTGDKSALDALLESARYYHNICVKYPSVAQQKARDPEHLNYLFPMAGWSRITLQLARKYPDKVTQKEVAEAEAFLKAIVAALKSTCEGDKDLDPEMGIPKKLANDFRSRAFNRAANGIGTIATASKGLEDLQAIKKTKAYQTTIDRYRRCVQEWIKN